jgi:LmbE family N-acetylglucosaminyl deacetylase
MDLRIIRKFILQLILLRSKNYFKSKNEIVIVSPHPDDEIFGLGGFLSKCSVANFKISIIYLTDGESSLMEIPPLEIAHKRINLSKDILARLKIDLSNVYRLHIPDSSIPFRNNAGFLKYLNELKRILSDINPESVFVTHPNDIWPYDHVAAFELTKKALVELDFKGSFYGYWVWLWYNLPVLKFNTIDWRSTFKIPIREFMEMKNGMIEHYIGSLAPNGKPYSGVLPKAFLSAFSFPYEMVTEFKINPDVED